MIVVLHLTGFSLIRSSGLTRKLSLFNLAFLLFIIYSTIVFFSVVTFSCISCMYGSLMPCLVIQCPSLHSCPSFMFGAGFGITFSRHPLSHSISSTRSTHSTNHLPTLSLDWKTCIHQPQRSCSHASQMVALQDSW